MTVTHGWVGSNPIVTAKYGLICPVGWELDCHSSKIKGSTPYRFAKFGFVAQLVEKIVD